MKDAYYFPHDYNARGDEKLVKLRVKLGWEGMGIYWAIIEKLHEAGGTLDYDFDAIAYDLKAEINLVRAVVNDFKLFRPLNQSKKFTSNRAQKNIKNMKEKSRKARQSAEIKWEREKSERNANALQSDSERYAIKGEEIKGDKRREEEKKGEEIKNHAALPPSLEICQKCNGTKIIKEGGIEFECECVNWSD